MSASARPPPASAKAALAGDPGEWGTPTKKRLRRSGKVDLPAEWYHTTAYKSFHSFFRLGTPSITLCITCTDTPREN